MEIGATRKVYLSQAQYVEKVLERFSMQITKSINSLLGNHFKLSEMDSPSSKERDEIKKGIVCFYGWEYYVCNGDY